MGTRWDKMLSDAGHGAESIGQKIGQAVEHEVEVIKEHNVETPAKIGQAIKDEVGVIAEHNKELPAKAVEAAKAEVGVVVEHNKKGALDILKEAEAEAVSVDHSVATKIEEHAKTIEGALKHALVGLAAKIRSGEEAITAELKAELAKVGIHL